MNEYHGVFNIICGVVRQQMRMIGMCLFDADIIRREIRRLRMIRELGGRRLP